MTLATGAGRELSSRVASEEGRAALALLMDRHFSGTAPAAPLRLIGLFNVSRPFLYKLIDQREISCFRVGTHRRLRLADVMALKQKRHEACGRALDALVELDEEEQSAASILKAIGLTGIWGNS